MAQTLVLDIDYNITKAEAKTRTLEAQWEQQNQKVKEQQRIVDDLQNQLDSVARARELNNKYLEQGKFTQEQYNENVAMHDRMEQRLTQEMATQNTELNLQKGKLGEIQANMNGVAASTKDVSMSAKDASASANGFGTALGKINKRILGLVKRVFFFSLITKALRSLRSSFTELIKGDAKANKELQQLKANLSVIGRILFETIKPVIVSILTYLNRLTQVVAVLLSKALGKDVDKMTKLAKKSKEVAENAKEAEKSLAGFDTLNVAQDNSNNGDDSGNGYDFSGIEAAKASMNDLATVAMATGGVLIGIGILLCIFGQYVTGIAAIAAGAFLLVGGATLADGKLAEKIKKTLAEILGIAGTALLAIGLIMCLVMPFSGIPFIIAGAGALKGSTAISGKTLEVTIKESLDKIGKMFKVMWNGLVSGGKAAFASIKVVFSTLGTFLKEVFSRAWKGIIATFSTGGKIFLNIGTSIFEAFKYVVNKIFEGINAVVAVPFKGINSALEGIKNIKILKLKPFSWIKTITVPKLPHLAEGGVIPGGREFMAVLGDQPAGQTNIEAPLETIKQALAEVLGGYNPQFNVKATGSMSQLIAMLNLKIEQEKNRASIWG